MNHSKVYLLLGEYLSLSLLSQETSIFKPTNKLGMKEMVKGYSNYPPYKHIRNRFGVTSICYVHNALKKGICRQILYSACHDAKALLSPNTLLQAYMMLKWWENKLYFLPDGGMKTCSIIWPNIVLKQGFCCLTDIDPNDRLIIFHEIILQVVLHFCLDLLKSLHKFYNLWFLPFLILFIFSNAYKAMPKWFYGRNS